MGVPAREIQNSKKLSAVGLSAPSPRRIFLSKSLVLFCVFHFIWQSGCGLSAIIPNADRTILPFISERITDACIYVEVRGKNSGEIFGYAYTLCIDRFQRFAVLGPNVYL